MGEFVHYHQAELLVADLHTLHEARHLWSLSFLNLLTHETQHSSCLNHLPGYKYSKIRSEDLTEVVDKVTTSLTSGSRMLD